MLTSCGAFRAALVTQSAPVPITRASTHSPASVGSSYDKYPVHDEVKAPWEQLSARGQLPEIVDDFGRLLEGADSSPQGVTPPLHFDTPMVHHSTEAAAQLAHTESHSALQPSRKKPRPDALVFNPSTGKVEVMNENERAHRPLVRMFGHLSRPSQLTYTTRILDNVPFEIPNKVKGFQRDLQSLGLTLQQKTELGNLEHRERMQRKKQARDDARRRLDELKQAKHKAEMLLGLKRPPESLKQGPLSKLPKHSKDKEFTRSSSASGSKGHDTEKTPKAQDYYAASVTAEHSPFAHISDTAKKGKALASHATSTGEQSPKRSPGTAATGSASKDSHDHASMQQWIAAHHSNQLPFTEPALSNARPPSPGASSQLYIPDPPGISIPSPPHLPWPKLDYLLESPPRHDVSNFSLWSTHHDAP